MSAVKKFKDLSPSLRDDVLAGVQAFGFENCTPVQAASIPLFLSNKDVAVQAMTGSGKTLAFLIPIVEILKRGREAWKNEQVGAVVVSPTRELARQTYDVLTKLLQPIDGLKPRLLVGGSDTQADIAECLRSGAQILIATPGRLLDVMARNESISPALDWRTVEVVVLDEADTLLDMGFKDKIDKILHYLPRQRRTGLFSATQTTAVKDLVRAGLRNPVYINVQVHSQQAAASGASAQATPTTLKNYFLLCEQQQKLAQLLAFLAKCSSEKVIVFFLTCATVDFFSKVLPQVSVWPKDFPLFALHGKMVQKKRIGMYNNFLEAKAGVLLCTDVAARGIDIPDVDWIVQYDPPKELNFFIHRIGRTARAGKSGQSAVFLTPEEDQYVKLLELNKVPMQAMEAQASAVDVADEIKSFAMKDRDVLEKGTQAFVSFVRGYKEHTLNYVFRFDRLDIASVAHTFGLLKLPKLKELRGRTVEYAEAGVNTATIAYKDKTREKQRQQRLAKEKEKAAAEADAKAAREQQKRAAKAAAAASAAAKRQQARKRKGQHQKMLEEWEEFGREERLAKKFRKGKISKKAFEAAIALSDEEELQSGGFVQATKESSAAAVAAAEDTSTAQKRPAQATKGKRSSKKRKI